MGEKNIAEEQIEGTTRSSFLRGTAWPTQSVGSHSLRLLSCNYVYIVNCEFWIVQSFNLLDEVFKILNWKACSSSLSLHIFIAPIPLSRSLSLEQWAWVRPRISQFCIVPFQEPITSSCSPPKVIFASLLLFFLVHCFKYLTV